jgi:hypothetical protein
MSGFHGGTFGAEEEEGPSSVSLADTGGDGSGYSAFGATVSKFGAGVAFRLRWSEESVEYYIRESFQAVGPLTEQAIQGAYLI